MGVFFEKYPFFGRVHPLASKVLFFNFSKCVHEKCARAEFAEICAPNTPNFELFTVLNTRKTRVFPECKFSPPILTFSLTIPVGKILNFFGAKFGVFCPKFARNLHEIFRKLRISPANTKKFSGWKSCRTDTTFSVLLRVTKKFFR